MSAVRRVRVADLPAIPARSEDEPARWIPLRHHLAIQAVTFAPSPWEQRELAERASEAR